MKQANNHDFFSKKKCNSGINQASTKNILDLDICFSFKSSTFFDILSILNNFKKKFLISISYSSSPRT